MLLRILLFMSAIGSGWSSYSYPRNVISILRVNNGGPWGEWLEPSFCADSTYAVGLSVKHEKNQGGGDDSALNSVMLHCEWRSDMFDMPKFGGDIQSGEGPWGDWYGPGRCKKKNGIRQFLGRFYLSVEENQGTGDDSAVNRIRFSCQAFKYALEDEDLVTNTAFVWTAYGWFGIVGSWSNRCPLDTAICGVQAKMEAPQGGGDDTALNDLNFFCCT